MMRFFLFLFVALFYTSQSSALLGGVRPIQKAVKVAGNNRDFSLTGIRSGGPAVFAAPDSNINNKRGSKLDQALGWYNYQLEKRPMVTKVVSSGLIGALSDILTQLYLQRNLKGGLAALDLRRVAVFTSVCALYFAPVIDAWFGFLSRIRFPKQFSDTGKAVGMVAIDQTLGAALVTSGFFYAFELAQRAFPPYATHSQSFLQVGTQNLQRNLLSTIKASWMCWPVINFINFKFVPLPYRVLFSNVASVFWNMYMTCVANSM